MNVLVCVKRVPMVGARITVTPDAQEIDTHLLGFTMSPHEECAVEEAVRLMETQGGTVSVLTLGPPEAVEQLRDTAAIGAGRLHPARDRRPGVGADRDGGRHRRGRQGGRSRKTGPTSSSCSATRPPTPATTRSPFAWRTPSGARVPPASSTSRSPGDAWRHAGSSVAATSCSSSRLPAVVSVKEGINLPRYPSLPGRMRAKKAAIEQTHAAMARGPRAKAGAPGPGRGAPACRDPRHGCRGGAGARRAARTTGGAPMTVLCLVEHEDTEPIDASLAGAQLREDPRRVIGRRARGGARRRGLGSEPRNARAFGVVGGLLDRVGRARLVRSCRMGRGARRACLELPPRRPSLPQAPTGATR